jgi:hypothetical protein
MWLNCPPSARLNERYADHGSDYAAEGTDAHALCEYLLRCALGENMSAVADIRGTLAHYDEEMEQHAADYAAYIMELLAEARQTCKDPKALVEQKIDYSGCMGEQFAQRTTSPRWAESGFGTADCVIVSDGKLHVVDFKYGKGVAVDADDNPQMKLYALGALEIFDGIYDVTSVSTTIFQPRRDNACTVSKESLYQWADKVLLPTAKLAFAGDGEYSAGGHCQFCKAKAVCKERARVNMEFARYDFQDPALLEDDEIEAILGKLHDLAAWAKDVQEYALAEALKGKRWSGWKLVRGTSRRKITDAARAAEVLRKNGRAAIGLEPYEKKLLGITAVTTLLGKKRFEDTLGDYIAKPKGKPVLVPETDKRQAITVNTAADDFADHEN